MDDGDGEAEESKSRMTNEPEVVSEFNTFFLTAAPQVRNVRKRKLYREFQVSISSSKT